jgi:hypothetical protein
VISFIHITGARTGGVDRIDEERFVLGRGPECAVRFHAERDRAVGKRHAEVELIDGRHLLCDRGSRNGTYVNGRLVKEVYLRHGDVIRLGAEGPQLRVDLTGADVTALLRAMRRRLWRPVWIPVFLLLAAGIGFAAIWAVRQVSSQLQGVEDDKAVLDGEIDALLAVLDSGEPAELDDLAARYDRMVDLEAQAAALGARLVRPDDGDDASMDHLVDEVLEAFGEPTYRVPATFRGAVRQRVGVWLGTERLGEIYCDSEANMPAVRSTLSRYNFPEVLAFLPWVLGGGLAEGDRADRIGPWAIGVTEGEELGLVRADRDQRGDPLAATEAIAGQLQRDLEALSTSSVLLASVARDPDIARTVATLREDGAWPRQRRDVRFLWLAGLLTDESRQRIPSLVAAAVVGGNPVRYGLDAGGCEARAPAQESGAGEIQQP